MGEARIVTDEEKAADLEPEAVQKVWQAEMDAARQAHEEQAATGGLTARKHVLRGLSFNCPVFIEAGAPFVLEACLVKKGSKRPSIILKADGTISTDPDFPQSVHEEAD